MIKDSTLRKIVNAQRNEITEYLIYKKLSSSEKNQKNRKILLVIANDELRHYNMWKKHTKRDISPSMLSVWFYYFISKIFGLTFGLKLMEKGENQAVKLYSTITRDVPEAKNILQDEENHEKKLISMIHEEKLNYIGSIVLGLSDALVEFTGMLAGLTFALQNSRLIALAGIVAGIAASFSMAASEYLSSKEEGEEHPLKAAVYTGMTYIVTVLLLIMSYLLFSNVYIDLTITIIIALLIILVFTFYTSVAKDLPFKKRFFEMALISISVAALSFCIGFIVRKALGINI
jgi:VIT1/CCC1 family predicted Fe2+/Mn2+ transporter